MMRIRLPGFRWLLIFVLLSVSSVHGGQEQAVNAAASPSISCFNSSRLVQDSPPSRGSR